MTKRILFLLFVVFFIYSFTMISSGGDGPRKSNKTVLSVKGDDGPMFNVKHENTTYDNSPLILEGSKTVGGLTVGPEIPITGLSGFYDYQFNGSNGHYINRASGTLMHAIYMLSLDSTNVSPSRRVKYATSTNDGANWSDLGEVPNNLRAGFCSLTTGNDGGAVIGSHYVGALVGGNLAGWVNYDLAPGIGSFSGVEVPPNFAWPLVTTMSNGNVLTMGTSYWGTVAGDTTNWTMFNMTSHTFGTRNTFTGYIPPADQNNSSMSSYGTTGGKAAMLLNPYRETGGNWGASRIFISTSNDNGATFSSPAMIFNPHVVNGDSIAPNVNGACDVILDASGNYYAAFNSNGPSGFFAKARLYIIKQGFNSGEPILVGGGPGTPPPYNIDSMATQMVAQNFIASFDHPCLSLSDDGQYVFVSYSVSFANDTSVGGFNRANVFYSFAKTSDMVFSAPQRVTTYGNDQKYASINRVTPKINGAYTIYMTYQKCKNAGSFAVGNNTVVSRASLIFRKITDAIIGVNNNQQTANDYKLNQNYPNPFNPATTITYSIPKNGVVTLTLFDVTGKEITTLVNGYQTAGQKVLQFNASGLASGVYFYTITAGDFKDTKKMILTK